MSTLLNKSYLVKVSTKGGGGQKYPKFCLRGLYMPPYCHTCPPFPWTCMLVWISIIEWLMKIELSLDEFLKTFVWTKNGLFILPCKKKSILKWHCKYLLTNMHVVIILKVIVEYFMILSINEAPHSFNSSFDSCLHRNTLCILVYRKRSHDPKYLLNKWFLKWCNLPLFCNLMQN